MNVTPQQALKKIVNVAILCSVCLGFMMNYTPMIASAQEKKMQTLIVQSKSVHGGRYVTGSIGEASNLIPYLATDASSHEVSDLLYISLLRYDKDLRIEAYAAKSYSLEENGTLLRFELHEGIQWEDGVELTADDVEFTWKIVTDPNTASPYAEDLLQVKEFRKTGKYSFEVRYAAYFSGALTAWMGAILPKHILEGQDLRKTTFSRKPMGAGPYRLKSWVAGSSITLTASPTYFKGMPNIQEIVFRIIPDISTMFLETRAGKLDMMNLTPQQYLRQTKGKFWDENYSKYRYLASSYLFLGFNMLHPFFKDVLVRRAISHAIDREGIVKGVLMGEGIASFGPYKPGSFVYHQELAPPKHDVALAKELLRKAGFADSNGDGIIDRDGKSFDFTILTNQGNEQRMLTAIVIQSQLKAVGIKAQIRTVEWAAFIKEFVDTGRFDAVILAWTMTPDPDLYDIWHSSKAKPGGLNFTRFTHPELDKILEEGRSTPDMHKRRELYLRLQELLAEEQPYCFLFVPYSLPVVHKRFQGIKPELAGIMYNFEKWWVPKKLQRFTSE